MKEEGKWFRSGMFMKRRDLGKLSVLDFEKGSHSRDKDLSAVQTANSKARRMRDENGEGSHPLSHPHPPSHIVYIQIWAFSEPLTSPAFLVHPPADTASSHAHSHAPLDYTKTFLFWFWPIFKSIVFSVAQWRKQAYANMAQQARGSWAMMLRA